MLQEQRVEGLQDDLLATHAAAHASHAGERTAYLALHKQASHTTYNRSAHPNFGEAMHC